MVHTRIRLQLDFGGARHEYAVGDGLLAELGPRLATLVRSGVCALVSDEALARTPHLVVAEYSLKSAGFHPTTLLVPAGESAKSVGQAERLWNAFADAGLDPDGVVVALGGGAVGDLAGFCAATWMRGVAIAHAPTTLLAMCDSSVGGKTSLDLATGKNLVEAFHQPRLVVADLATLYTLPDREYRSGFGEIVKCAILRDRIALSRLRQGAKPLLARDREALAKAIAATVEVKAELVKDDVREHGERRVLLNLGHTTAHAIEAASEFRGTLHGEAVAIGLVIAARITVARGLCDVDRAAEIVDALRDFGLPTDTPKGLDVALLISRTRLDKKRRGGRRRMVLPQSRGGAEVYDVDDVELADALAM